VTIIFSPCNDKKGIKSTFRDFGVSDILMTSVDSIYILWMPQRDRPGHSSLNSALKFVVDVEPSSIIA
jgi:hypothetical protein